MSHGALTNKGVVGTAIAAGRDAQSLTAEELHRLPVFAGVSGTFLELNRGAIVKRGSLPDIAPAKIMARWLPHAKFDHDAHRSFTCASCHVKALTSTESSDLLMPGIENCKACHAPGPEHAESRCFVCHTYHDWSKRKEVKPAFTLPALRTVGR